RGDRPPARRPGHPLAGEVRSASIAHRSAKTGSCARSQSSSKTNRDRIVRAEELMSSDPSLSVSGDIAAWRLLEGETHPRERFDPLWKLAYMWEHPLHFPLAAWTALTVWGDRPRADRPLGMAGYLQKLNSCPHAWQS